MVWLVVHLVATAMLTGVAWVSLVVIYPAFALVGPAEWPGYHAAHVRAITRVIVAPWVGAGRVDRRAAPRPARRRSPPPRWRSPASRSRRWC